MASTKVRLSNTPTVPLFKEMIDMEIGKQQNQVFFKEYFKYESDQVNVARLYKRFVRLSCNKLVWSLLKQMELNSVGVTLRDEFKYGHIQRLKSVHQT